MITERVDDIPLLIAEFEKSKLSSFFNQYFPDHGNWQGLDGGKAAVVFLTYILSCGDHRLSHVETWVSQRLTTLRYALNAPSLKSKDLTDDKLGSLLDKFSNEEKWSAFEHAHNQQLINVYNLNTDGEAIRLDAMITQSHKVAQGDFQHGHSKQHRQDLPQLKTMVATLDPFAIPLYSVTVAGNTGDDVLYIPVITELVENLVLSNQLFVGDSKMGSQKNRATIHSKNHYYLMPLNQKQCSLQQVANYLEKKPEQLVTISTKDKKGKKVIKAKIYEQSELMSDESLAIQWEERRLLVYSPTYAYRQQKIFEDRLVKASNELAVILEAKQGRRHPKTRPALELKIEKILKKHKVKKFFNIHIQEHTTSRIVQSYLDRPQEMRTKTHFTLDFEINELEKANYLNQLGWRVYASNAPMEKLSTSQAIECYRNEYRIEHKFDELLNRVTALMPVFIQKEHRIKALIRLLLLALKFVSLIQYQVRTELKTTKQNIKELYPGNPGRATDKPTTPMILRAFKNITLVIMSVDNKIIVKVSDLKPIQLKILKLLKIPPEKYTGLNELFFSHSVFSET